MTVYLVGAGPGDPGLMTLRGAEVLAEADVVVHDRLADPSLLELAPDGAERVDVGKRPGDPVRQDEINALLVERAKAGLQVVRLKGGDPFVFGRGGEEAQALAQAGVEFEVVPGVTAAVAVPAYAGVPVTHRGLATSFLVVTGHSAASLEREIDWEAVGRVGATVVVLMGVAHRAEIAKRLMDSGRRPDTPVAAVSFGTRASQRTVRTTLEDLGAAELETPATIVIGEVAALDLSWFEKRPLLGRRVVLTRPRAQLPGMAARLRDLGAEPIEAPVISIEPPADGGSALRAALSRVGSYDWVVFTSANAVEPVMREVGDPRSFGASRIAAIGPGTAAELQRWRLVADLVPQQFVAEALVDEFPSPGEGAAAHRAGVSAEGGSEAPPSVLLPRAAEARDVLPKGLSGKGWRVDVVEAYRVEKVALAGSTIQTVRGADAVAFTSPSTVDAFLAAAGRESLPPVVACIGPVTAAAARRLGVEVSAVAGEHTVEGLIAALRDALARPSGG